MVKAAFRTCSRMDFDRKSKNVRQKVQEKFAG